VIGNVILSVARRREGSLSSVEDSSPSAQNDDNMSF